jgi:tryptophan-rich sensory protein
MDLGLFAVYLVACGAAATTGAVFPPGTWYRALAKPAWTPPDWMFPVAWVTLYLLMSAAAARVGMLPGAGLAMAFWAVQIAFNTLWSPVFFGLQRIGAALWVMVGLWSSVAATAVLFWQLDPLAGVLMLPYVAWVSVAGALNFWVWRANRSRGAAVS